MKQKRLLNLEKYQKRQRAFYQIIQKGILPLIMLLIIGLGTVKAQNVTITSGNNPAAVVSMGDSLVFPVQLYSSAAISNCELEIEVPSGFELLTTTPNFKGGSLSADKLTGRISIASLPANSVQNYTVYVKPLCDASTATEVGSRKITYRFFISSSASSPLTTRQIDNGIQNFYEPILNVVFPGDSVVSLLDDYSRTFTFIQTREYSHINNLEVTAVANTSGIAVKKVEVRRNNSTGAWVEIPVETTPTGYRYILSRNTVFTIAQGYPNKQLGYGDSLMVRETVSLLKCGQGTITYAYKSGDGVTFCDNELSDGSVMYKESASALQPDLLCIDRYKPKNRSQYGVRSFKIMNSSADAGSLMHNIRLRCYNVKTYEKAYFATNLGQPVLFNGDTVWLTDFTGANTDRYFTLNNMNDPAMISFYESVGLSDADGDGVYNDLRPGKNLFINVLWKYRETGNCGQDVSIPGTMNAAVYYTNFCGVAASFQRSYSSSDPGLNTTIEPNYTTNQWTGQAGFYEFRTAELDNINPICAGDQANLKIQIRCTNGGSPGMQFSDRFITECMGATKTSDVWSYLVLPAGLSYDSSKEPQAVKAGNTWLTKGTHYTVSSTLDTIKIHWTTNWGFANYALQVAIKGSGVDDPAKTAKVYHEYDFGKEGIIQQFGCYSKIVPYIQCKNSTYFNIEQFDADRTSFGYTSTNKSYQVTTLDEAKSLGFNTKQILNLDNVLLRTKSLASSSFSISAADRVIFKWSWNYGFNYLDKQPGLSYGARIYYKNNATPVDIPSVNVTKYESLANDERSLSVDIAPYLRNNFNAYNFSTGDSIIVELYVRATEGLPDPLSNFYITSNVYSEIGAVSDTCTPRLQQLAVLSSKLTSWRYSKDGTYHMCNKHNATVFGWGIAWASGTGSLIFGNQLEYRPNVDEMDTIKLYFNSLVDIDQVEFDAYSSNWQWAEESYRILDTSEWKATYSAGKTYLSIVPHKSFMVFGGYGGINIRTRINVINYNNGTSGAAYTVNAIEYPTSGSPRVRNYGGQGMNFAGQSYTYPYAYAISALPANAVPLSSLAEWKITVQNNSYFANNSPFNTKLPHSWIAVECPAGVTPHELRDGTTNIPVAALFEQYAPNKYWIKLGEITAGLTKDYILACSYTVCTGTPTVKVKYGMGNVAYPTDPDQGYANYNSPGVLAGVVSTQVSFTPPAVKFSSRLQHIANMPGGTNAFCDTLTFEGSFSNGLGTSVNNLQLRIDYNRSELSGYSFYSGYTPQVKFGNGAWNDVQSASVSGNVLLITLDDTKELLGYGAANDGDKAFIRFKMNIACGIENGMQIPTEFIGHSGCGSSTVERVATVSPIRIHGLIPPPDYWIENLSLVQNSFTGSSGGDGVMILRGNYRQAETAATDVQAIIDLPENLVLDGINMPSINFTQQGRRLIANLPDNTAMGTSFPFDLTLRPTNPEQWSMDSTFIYVRVGKLNNLSCDGITCTLTELGERQDSVTVSMEKLQVHISENIVANSRYSDETSERVVIEGWLVNDGDIDAGRLTMDLWYFNGVYYEPVKNVVSGLTMNAVPQQDSIAFKIITNVSYLEDVCNMVVVLRKNNTTTGSVNPYLADSSSMIVPVPIYKISAEVDPICQMNGNVEIGELPIRDYSYEWIPSDYLSRSNVARPYFTYDYENKPIANDTILKYAIRVIRPNQCISVDTLEVPLKGIPYVQDFEDITLCSGEPLYIEFKDTTNNLNTTTFSWIIENGPSVGLPASGTRAIIDVLSVRNNTTQPIVLQCRVTPKKNNCEGVTKIFFITVNPKVQINHVVSQSYCNGVQVASQLLSGNLSSAIYRWEYESGHLISGLNSGVNVIPGFMANNSGTTPITGTYRAYAEYENTGVTCYSDTVRFSVNIEPSPIVNTVGDRHICSGSNLTVNFSGTSVEKYYWQKVSGSNIPGLSSSGDGNISVLSVTNNTSNPISAVYKVIPTRASGVCSGIEDNFTIIIYPDPVLTSDKIANSICSGSIFDYTATSSTKDLIYSWERLPNASILGAVSTGNTASISESLVNITESPTTVQYKYTLLQEAYCPKTETISVVVNPLTDFVLLNPQNTICAGSATNIMLNYTTSNTLSGLRYRINYSDVAKANGFADVLNGTLPAGNIPAVLPANLPAGVYTGIITVYFAAAQDCVKDYAFTITVNPIPVLTNEKIFTICSGEELNVSLTSSEQSTSFSWVRAAHSAINNNAGKTGNGSVLREVLTSTSTTSPVTIKYLVNSRSGSCSNTDTLTVTVNPKPMLNNIPSQTIICSGDSYVYNNPSSHVSGAVISWERYDIVGIDEPGRNGVGSINEVLTNNTTSSIVVTYEFTIQANGCSNTELVKITVNPLPVLTSSLYPGEICSGGIFNYTARTATRNVTFGWVRQTLPANVSGTNSSGTDPRISDQLTNTNSYPVIVKYDVKMTLPSGCINTETIEIIVNPMPKLNSGLSGGDMCSGNYFVYDITSATQGANFTWRRQNNPDISEAVSNSGSPLISEKLTVREGVTASVTVKYTIITEANGCRNQGEELELVVNPLPTLSVDKSPVSLAAGASTDVTATTDGIIVGWTSSNLNVVTVTPDAASQNKQAKFQAVNAGTTYVMVEVRNTTTGCINKQNILVNVGAQNTAALSLALGYPSQICNGQGTDLSIDISGGDSPFTAIYAVSIDGGVETQVTVNNLQSTGRITVSPANSGNTISSAVYRIISVTDNGGQPISVLGNTVTVLINPTANITTLFSPIEVCEKSTVSIPTFNSNVSGVSYEWTNDNPAINLSMSGTGNIPKFIALNGHGADITAMITVRAQIKSGSLVCAGPDKDFTITVHPQPTFVVLPPAAICEGDNYAFSTLVDIASIQPSGSTVKFYHDLACQNEIIGSVAPVQTTTYYVKAISADNCASQVQEITLIVYPKPTLNSSLALTICSGDALSYTATSAMSGVSFVWSRAAVSGISNPVRTNVNGSTINETLVNTTNAPVVVAYSIEMAANGCSKSETVNVTVNPKPVLNNDPGTLTICSGTAYTYMTPASNVSSATISWERLPVNGIAEGMANGTGSINEVLTNTTANPVMVTYLFTLQTGGCSNTQSVSVMVNPSPELNSALYLNPICNGGKINYTARTLSKNINFSWSRASTTGINGGAANSGIGAVISETLTNSTTAPITVLYKLTMTVLGSSCSESEFVEIVVNPTPVIEAKTIADICSNDNFVYDITSATENANFTWIRPKNSNIIESAATGNSSMISEKLTVRSGVSTPVSVDYIIFTGANGCLNSGETISVIVNPLPEVNIISPTPVNLATNATQIVEASTTGTVVGWSSSNTSIVEVTAEVPDTKAKLTAKAEGIAQITLEVKNASGCINQVSFTVNVGAENTATMSLANGAASQLCNGDNTMLQMEITGGKAPFTVIYHEGAANQTISVSSSNGKFQVTPDINTGNSVEVTNYTLVSVTDANNQPITVIASSVAIEVNPTAKITNTASLSSRVCQGAILSTPKFETNITDQNRVSYVWFNDNPGIGLAVSGSGHLPTFRAENGTGAPIIGNITAVATYRGLVNCQDLTEEISFTITIDPKPDFVVINPEAICAGTSIDLNAKANEIVNDIMPSNVDIEFFSLRSCDPLSKITAAVSPLQTTIYYVRLTSDEVCISDVKEVVVTVNTVPVADIIPAQVLCNNTGMNIQLTGNLAGTTYEWRRIDSETDIIGLASSGTNVVYAHRLSNNTTVPKTATIEVIPKFTANGVTCTGTAVTFDVTVNPTPVLNVNLLAGGICSGDSPIYTLSSLTPGVIISWERLDNESIAESPRVVMSNIIDETLTNLTQKTVNVRYAVTLEIGSCVNVQYVTVPVYPIPVLTSDLQAGQICSGGAFIYQATTAVKDATITWKRQTNSSLLEPEDIGFVPMPISEVILTNTTAIPTVVKYDVMITANGCSNTQEIEVVVGPTLLLTSSNNAGSFCSGDYITYTATSDASNIQYSWEREFNSNLEQSHASGSGAKINERVFNYAATQENVTYNITMKTSNGCQETYPVYATINPLPEISVSETEVKIAAGATRTLYITDANPTSGNVISLKSAIATASFDPSTLEITVNAIQAGYTELIYRTTCINNCINEIIIPITVTNGPMGTLSLAGVSTVCSEGNTQLQVTDILNGKGPWEVEINYNGGDNTTIVPVTIGSIMELPKVITIALPENISNNYTIYNYSVTKITDSEGAVRENHMGKPAITVLPVPKVNPMESQEICNGSKNDIVYFTGVATNYKWSIDSIIGIDLIGEGIKLPPFILEHNRSYPVKSTITITPEYTLNGLTCTGVPDKFNITVNPLPEVEPINNIVTCHESTINIPITGNNATEFLVSAGPLVGLLNNEIIPNNGILTFTANNSTNEVVSAEITVTPVYKGLSKDCYGTSIIFKVTVNPKPNITQTEDMEFCTGTKVDAYEFTGGTPGATYTWKQIGGDNILGLPTSGTKQLPSFTAYNTQSVDIVAVYEVSATINNMGNICGDKKDTFQITIHPEPIINYSVGEQSYCVGETTQTITFGDISITTYDWKQTAGYNIGLSPNYGSDTIPSFVTVNTTSSLQIAVIEVYPRIKNTACVGKPLYFNIEVKPAAILTSPLDNDSICSGSQFIYEATSTSDKVHYKWNRPAIADINNGNEKQGQGYMINEKLNNTSDAPVEVLYILNLEYEGCQSYDTIKVVVNPTPAIKLDAAIYNACPLDSVVELTYTTTNVNLPIEYMVTFDADARSAGFENMLEYASMESGKIVIPMPGNVTSQRYHGIISIISYGCSGVTTYPFTINVRKQTVITRHPESEILSCSSGVYLYLTVEADGENLTYQWYKDEQAISGATTADYEKFDSDTTDHGVYYVEVGGTCGTVVSVASIVRANVAYIQRKWDDVLFISNIDTGGSNLHFVKYQWYKEMPDGKLVAIGTNSNKQYYQITDNKEAVYVVEVVYTNGESLMSCPYTYTPTQQKSFKIYPNPVSSRENIQISMEISDRESQRLTVEIFDVSGIQIYSGKLEGSETRLPMSVTSGIYTVRITDNQGVVRVEKVIVK